MTRRRRALVLGAGAVACGLIAASISRGYGEGIAGGYGELRHVVVAAVPLSAGAVIGGRRARGELELRRVPERFVPPDALGSPAAAVGLRTRAPVPAGSYLVASNLRPPGTGGRRRGAIAVGQSPVEVSVSGAAALAAAGITPGRTRVDVVVSAESRLGGSGRTFVAASGVILLGLRENGEAGTGRNWTAVLDLSRAQALRLIEAEAFARDVRVLVGGR